MTAAGIVAEFNPLHQGHLYLLQTARNRTTEDTALICVMSGDFVQRGEAAIFPKHCRAKAAIAAGADLVVELPVPWSISSAERFATGSIGILDKMGASFLFFGSESGNTAELCNTADLLLSDDVRQKILQLLHTEKNISYAVAREQVVRDLTGNSEVLQHANDILGVEYLKAIRNLDSKIQPAAIKRIGAGHNSMEEAVVLSASAIRNRIQMGHPLYDLLPDTVCEVYQTGIDQGVHPLFPEYFEDLLFARLRFLKEDELELTDDAGNGLGRAIYSAIHSVSSMEELYQSLSTKRYTTSRIRRICLKAALRCEPELQLRLPPYARILAANEKGCAYISEHRAEIGDYLLIKPSAVNRMGQEAKKVFQLNSEAHDFYVLGYRSRSLHTGGQDWKQSPIIIKTN